MANWEKKTSSEAGLGSEGRSWALLPLSLTQGILGVERRSTLANGKGWEKNSVNCSVAETKLTLTSLEGWIRVQVELCWPDPYLRSPALRVTRDFPMQLHRPAVHCCIQLVQMAVHQWWSWQRIFQLDSRAAALSFSSWTLLLLKLHSWCSEAHSSKAWGQRNGAGGGEVRDSLHETRPAVCCISQFGTRGKYLLLVCIRVYYSSYYLYQPLWLVGCKCTDQTMCAGDPIASHQPG